MKTKIENQLINDELEFVGATRNGHPIKTYDDTWGELYISRDSMGINGIVRAASWEDAYSICEDEFFREVTAEEMAEFEKEYSTVYASGRELWKFETGLSDVVWFNALTKEEKGRYFPGREIPFDSAEGGWSEHPCWQEAYGFMGNAGKEGTGIYHRDLNGDYLDVLTPDLAAELEITIETGEYE